jgi:hypothetical protein
MSTIKTETLSTPSNATVPVDTVVNGTAKAWVNFNGTSTVAIRRAFNVSSITDNGTGDYTVNFTTAMPDANYAEILTVGRFNDRNNLGTLGIQTTYAGNKTTTFARLITQSSTITLTDMDMVDVAIFS